MRTVIDQWIGALKRKNYAAGANFWYGTPQALGIAVSKLFRPQRRRCSITRTHGNRRLGKIYRLDLAEDFSFSVGVIETQHKIGLVSPQTVYRRHISRNWHHCRTGGVKIIAEKKALLSTSVQWRVKNAVSNIHQHLAHRPTAEFRYYVPSRETYRSLLRMENQVFAPTDGQKRSWSDPFGGDVISRDPSDVHELAHGCANALAGWPPRMMREGLAECFTTPYDWYQWVQLRRPPGLTRIWSAPPGSVPGWYTGAAIFMVMAYGHLGTARFIDFWNRMDEHADCREAAEAMNLSLRRMQDKYGRFCRQSFRHCGSAVPSGLINRLL